MRNSELPGRSLAVGRHGMAATSHPTATLTAVEVLEAGGTAAVAACAVQGVVETGSTGVRGDCFVLMAPSGGDTVLAYNGSGRTPAAASLSAVAAQGATTLDRSSPHAITVPGAIEAWTRLVADHGLHLQSAMDLPRLFPLPGTATIEMEARLRENVGETLRQRGFKVQEPRWAIGGSQAIWIDWEHGTLLGGSDHRKDG